MEKVKFKSSLFGFKRRQVLQYVNATCQGYEQQLLEQKTAHEEFANQARQQVNELSGSLENSRIVCAEQAAQLERLEGELAQKEESLTQAAELVNQLLNRVQSEQQRFEELEGKLEQKNQLLSRKDAVIATQAVEVSRLEEQVTKLEAEFERLRGQTEQSTALVNCLNVLHQRNRNLLTQIASLETRLEDMTNGQKVEQHTKTVAQNQQMITSTEQLFAALRQEIGEALDTISSKIESGSISETDDGNYFVDMANL